MSKIITKIAGVLILLTLTLSANAAIMIVSGGKLIGATGINVNGSLYDVSFLDGSCETLFDGCDEVNDFTFRSYESAIQASYALADQVFLDDDDTNTIGGDFGSRPYLTAGCALPESTCRAATPYSLPSSLPTHVNAALFINSSNDNVRTVGYLRTTDLTPIGWATWASWNLSSVPELAAVPEPTTLALLGAGLLGVSVTRRRRTQNTIHSK